jgi:CRISPR-associated protein Cmr2
MNWLGIGPKETVKESFNGIPVTPVYLIALSRSLAVTAIRDANAVSKDGVLIFAGGDDIMFLSPVERSLDLVRETRSHYWGNPVGFHVLDELYFAVFDAQPLYGRSYGVLIAHYKDAVYNLWDIAGQMEEMKDEIKVGDEKSEGENKKDVTIVLRGRGISGLRDAAILYNYPVLEGSGVYKSLRLRTFEVFDKLRESLSGSKDKLSKSFVKDWLSLDEDEFREFTNDAISYLIRNNSMSKWRETKLKELYDSLTGLNLKLVWEGDNKERDERTELIKTYDYLEV